MTSELKVDKITPASGTNTQIGEAGDTTNLSAGTVTLPTSIITGASEKTTLVDADKFLIADSADSNAFKHVQKSNLPSGTFVQTGRTVISGGNPASVVIDNCFSSTYDTYMVVVDKVEMTVDSQRISTRLRDSGGSVTASNYKYAARVFDDDANTSNVNANSPDNKYDITNETDDSSNNGGLNGVIYVHRPNSANEYTAMNSFLSFYNNTVNDVNIAIGGCKYQNPETHTGIEFNITAGGMRDGGSFTVYGIAYS
jgi:hypothetical protein